MYRESGYRGQGTGRQGTGGQGTGGQGTGGVRVPGESGYRGPSEPLPGSHSLIQALCCERVTHIAVCASDVVFAVWLQCIIIHYNNV